MLIVCLTAAAQAEERVSCLLIFLMVERQQLCYSFVRDRSRHGFYLSRHCSCQASEGFCLSCEAVEHRCRGLYQSRGAPQLGGNRKTAARQLHTQKRPLQVCHCCTNTEVHVELQHSRLHPQGGSCLGAAPLAAAGFSFKATTSASMLACAVQHPPSAAGLPPLQGEAAGFGSCSLPALNSHSHSRANSLIKFAAVIKGWHSSPTFGADFLTRGICQG